MFGIGPVGLRSRLGCFMMAALFARACPTLLVLLLAASAIAQDSSAEAKTAYADAANFQNNGAFDLAVEEWEKFLKDFPKDPLAPKARHYLGVCLMQQKKYPEAVAAFDAVQKENPKFELLEDTLLNLGWSQYQLAGSDKAMYPKSAETLAALMERFPKANSPTRRSTSSAKPTTTRGRSPRRSPPTTGWSRSRSNRSCATMPCTPWASPRRSKASIPKRASPTTCSSRTMPSTSW
jgi:tetratricopeptide (TPR) repeat protein